VTEERLRVQTVGHIAGYCLGQRDTITVAHHATWKTLQSVIVKAAPKVWNFPSVKGELTMGQQLWGVNKMDETCTTDALWETTKDSEMKRTLSPSDEEACTTVHDPRKSRKSKPQELFLSERPSTA
jgi:hypothetical protein